MTATGLVIAAPASGSGKTIVTLGLLRACRRRGLSAGSAKVGPDYIDPRYHEAASGVPCTTLDGWAMRRSLIGELAWRAARDVELLIIEGVMGLFDGAPRAGPVSDGSTAGMAQLLGLPVVLVIDASRQGQSVAATVHGFRTFRPGPAIAGVILNRVSGPRHERLLRDALERIDVPVFGAIPATDAIVVPSRHLGLVQAGEIAELERFLDAVAGVVDRAVDLAALVAAAAPLAPGTGKNTRALPPPGQRIALARDRAFGFAYEHLLDGWRARGAEIAVFSPLADEPPPAHADAVYLPGGYPELHAGRIAAATRFMSGLCAHACAGHPVYGECGGYMVLGSVLHDDRGAAHPMAGLLALETGMAGGGLSLGYRLATARSTTPLAARGSVLRGHEFHHARVIREDGDALFDLEDSTGTALGTVGLRSGPVFGSFFHVIDRS